MTPTLAVELARLLLAGADSSAVAARLSPGPGAPALEAVLALGQRARANRATEEQTALALGLLGALEAAPAGSRG